MELYEYNEDSRMYTRQILSQKGIGHTSTIVIVAALTVVGASAWWTIAQQHTQSIPPGTRSHAVHTAHCEYDDALLCKFFASWKANDHFTLTAQQDNSANPVHMVIETQRQQAVRLSLRGPVQYDAVVLGDTTYVKDSRDNAWWKQMHTTDSRYQAPAKDYISPYELQEPTTATLHNFKKLGQEACGTQTCLKYEVINPDVPADKQLIWIDTTDYLLRRMHTTGAQNTNFSASFDYRPVDITAPATTKELAAGYYIVPGQNQPTALPKAPSKTELDTLMQQR
jgi:hypothetical protein